MIAEPLANLAKAHPDLSIGSYPFFGPQGYGSNLVVRGRDGEEVERTVDDLMEALADIGRQDPSAASTPRRAARPQSQGTPMRCLAVLAVAVALGAPPALARAAPADDPRSLADVRCIIVSGTLAGSDDQEMKSVGYASLLYFWGRLEGRGVTANISPMVVDQARRMSAADVKAQAETCKALFTAAGQNLQDLSSTLEKELGGQAAAPPAAAPPAAAP